MKRRELWAVAPPERLMKFDLRDWPPAPPWEAFKMWQAARDAYQHERGWLGGPVERILGDRQERQRLAAWLYGSATQGP